MSPRSARCNARRYASRISAVVSERSTPPGKGVGAECRDEVVSSHPAVSAVAVGERMDSNDAAMEPDRDFVDRVRVVLDPHPGVVDQIADCRRDLLAHNSDVGLPEAVATCPFPHLAEHRPVQFSEVPIVEQFLDVWLSTQ